MHPGNPLHQRPDKRDTAYVLHGALNMGKEEKIWQALCDYRNEALAGCGCSVFTI